MHALPTPPCSLFLPTRYFNVRGHGQRVRYALAGAGLDWEEVSLTQPGSMDAVRPELLFNQVPLVEIDGLKLVQSWAIVRYIATKDCLSPADQARPAICSALRPLNPGAHLTLKLFPDPPQHSLPGTR